MRLAGLHHVTCVCSDAQQTLDFYRQLGLTLVKKTVNFDDPHSYHLYFGDDAGRPRAKRPATSAAPHTYPLSCGDDGGRPGTLLTFLEWPRADAGRLGRGT